MMKPPKFRDTKCLLFIVLAVAISLGGCGGGGGGGVSKTAAPSSTDSPVNFSGRLFHVTNSVSREVQQGAGRSAAATATLVPETGAESVAGAQVRLTIGAFTAMTSSAADGIYSFRGVPNGTGTVTFDVAGHVMNVRVQTSYGNITGHLAEYDNSWNMRSQYIINDGGDDFLVKSFSSGITEIYKDGVKTGEDLNGDGKSDVFILRSKDYPGIVDEALKDGRQAVIYFYSTQVKDSGKQIDDVKKLIADGRADFALFTVDYKYENATDTEDILANYNIEYMPTIIFIDKDYSVKKRLVVDFTLDSILKALSPLSETQVLPPMASIKNEIAAGRPFMVFVYATWCGYSKKMEPVIEDFSKKYGDKAGVIKVDNDKNQPFGDLLAVTGTPNIFLYDSHGAIIGYYGGYNAQYTAETFKSNFEAYGAKF